MSTELTWLVGVIIGMVGLVGGIVARDRFIMRLIATASENSAKALHAESSGLHERVNRVRDEYVRRVDLDGHIQRLDSSVQQLASEMRNNSQSTNVRLDQVLSHLISAKSKE